MKRQVKCKFGHKYTQGKTRQYCQVCKNINTKKWRKENPKRVVFLRRRKHLKAHFNLTREAYRKLWVSQKGLCAACQEPLPRKENGNRYPPVDHSHKTRKVRGIVHTKCNRGIGLFNDSPERMRRVADYLERNA